ncbi:hypothetical protein NQ314_010960 [Rhamnusium bicolor]|uniref:Uncharacterized protein n=1 Tax=Rhamnusium bicolor TaxID=1586634 RepID=A0AAV8XLH4_9CUCU|nr:hypothetical protein NQ314_010960 [Rhamnusium bicolor]
MLESAQRKILIRVASGYWTVSAVAVQTVTGVPPIDLLFKDRVEMNKASLIMEANRRELARCKVMERW